MVLVATLFDGRLDVRVGNVLGSYYPTKEQAWILGL
jgi:hypothetical protein